MRGSKKIVFALAAAALCALAAGLSAMEWPLSGATVLRNFGYNDGGRPTLGVVLAGEGDARAAGDGELFFQASGERDSIAGFTSPLGSWVALDHGNGLVSAYARLGDAASGARTLFRQGDRIAAPGASGWSAREGVFFMVFDRKERRWVNPAMIAEPFADAIAPQILSVQLRAADGELWPALTGQTIPQGSYGILVRATDALSGGAGALLAPHRIVASVNGVEAGRVSLETMGARDGSMLVDRGSADPAAAVYAFFPAFEAGSVLLNRGQAIIEVVVSDLAGNSSRALAQIIVE